MNWTPYYPVDYPIRDGLHNPWIPLDPISKLTGYDVWVLMRGGSPHHPESQNIPVTEAQLRAKIAEIRSQS